MQDLVQTYLAEKSRRITIALPDYLGGRHVRAFREATRLSRSEFAVFVGMSAHWVKWFENGNLPLKGTSTRTQVNIAEAAQELGYRWPERSDEPKPDEL